MLQRYRNNPIIQPHDLKPLNKDFKIIGVFNPAAFVYQEKIYLLLRVAEQPINSINKIKIPMVKKESGKPIMSYFEVDKNDPELAMNDVRKYSYKGMEYLSSLSHFRLASSEDGIHFEINSEAWLLPDGENENFGIEDARVTNIDDTYYINFTAASSDGYVSSLVTTKDFLSIERKGIIFPPLNKDVALFPEKINGKYFALHRPEVAPFGKPSIWMASSPDLIHWGEHHVLFRPDGSQWNEAKIGGGPPPIKTEKGWLIIYHGVGLRGDEHSEFYSLSALLLDLKNPQNIIGHVSPILVPEMKYETDAFVKNVVFSNGAVLHPKTNELMVYYGAGDESIGLTINSLKEFMNYF
jgi:predicted GH43/DUF377 family glycosyl hydrolase